MSKLKYFLSYVPPVFRTIMRMTISPIPLLMMLFIGIGCVVVIAMFQSVFDAKFFGHEVWLEIVDVTKWAISPVKVHAEQERDLR